METTAKDNALELTASSDLVAELVRRSDHAIVVLWRNGLRKSGEGQDLTVHVGGFYASDVGVNAELMEQARKVLCGAKQP